MDKPTPNPADRPQRHPVDDAQTRSWLRLRQELSELNARLQYLRLMVRMGVRRIG